MKAKVFSIISLCVIAIVSIALRTYRITAPIADWHSWRQADTAAVARNFQRFGIDLLHPRYDDLSNIQSGKDNPQGYRMVEFPLYQATAVWLSDAFGRFPIEVWLRVLAIAASTISGFALGVLVWRRINAMTGICAAFLYAVLPYSIFYGRAILPDGIAVCFALVSILLFDYAVGKQKQSGQWFLTICAAMSAAIAILIKPVAGFVLLPLVGIGLVEKKERGMHIVQMAVYATIALIPFFLWRTWIQQYPEGIPAFDWLFNKDQIRFKGAWFYWIFAERIGKLILGYWGVVLVGFGLVEKSEKKERLVSLLFALGALLYVSILAGGNVQHDYYQILILPALIVYGAKGLAWIGKAQWHAKGIQKITIVILGAILCAFTVSFSWYTVRTYYWINHQEIVDVGRRADALLPKDAKVIAPYNGDTTFLYQIGRQGWPIGFDIDNKIRMGATHYVTISPTDADLETRDLAAKYTVIERNDRYAIIDLTRQR